MAAQSLMEPIVSSNHSNHNNTSMTMTVPDNASGSVGDNLGNSLLPGNGVPDFVKKLYRQPNTMLEEKEHDLIVSWGKNGETFVVKEPNEFARFILPKHFKHSNFASFVRQLNKYDFHKIKVTEDSVRPYGDQAWEFQHPKFQIDKRDLLEEIKRKTPNNKKTNGILASASSSDQLSIPEEYQVQLDLMSKNQVEMQDQLLRHKSRIDSQEALIQNLIKMLGYQSLENGALSIAGHSASNSSKDSKHLKQKSHSSSRSRVSSQPHKIGSQLAHALNTSIASSSSSSSSPSSSLPISTLASTISIPISSSIAFTPKSTVTQHPFQLPPMCQDPSVENPIYSLSHLTKKQDDWAKPKVTSKVAQRQQHQHQHQQQLQHHQRHDNFQHSQQFQQQQQQQQPQQQQHQQQHQQRQIVSHTPLDDQNGRAEQNNFPNWTTPPKVLLVEDDDTCRRLSSRLLQIFGCPFDVAEDGLSAVGKMSHQKYDIVLMDIMMPKLDGVSATTQIRQFDPMTPIISMTSNTTEHDIMTYFANGMNDILPKPFTRAGLLGMLEKHCQHLKYIKIGSNLLEVSSGSDNHEGRIVLTHRQGDSSDAENIGFSLTGFPDQDNMQLVPVNKNGNSNHQNHPDMSLQLGLSNMLIINGVDSSLDNQASSGMQLYARQAQQQQHQQGGLKQQQQGIESNNEGDHHGSQTNFAMNPISYSDMMDISRDDSSNSSLSPDQSHIQLNPSSSHHSQQPLRHGLHGSHPSHLTSQHHQIPTPPSSSQSNMSSSSRYTQNLNSYPSFSTTTSPPMMATYSSGLDSPYSHPQQHQHQHQHHQNQHGSITLLSIKSDDGIAHTLGLMNRGVDFPDGLGGLGHAIDQSEMIDTQGRRKRTKVDAIE
ncbi:kinase-regulated stress-responsive transcription factor skn7 [Entomortierella beljakovae]|nr:kinase-regulated stress-responsive transcription factor skn7 [Entomortierella beljakovae]